MSEVGSYEAKTHLPRLLDEVESGGSVTITRNGRPVARLVPIKNDSAASTVQRILELRRRLATDKGAGKLSMRELIDAGRR